MAIPLSDLQQIWRSEFAIVPQQLRKLQQINKVACAFNTNIDAIVKVSGAQINKWLNEFELTDINGCNKISSPQDVIRGVLKCFISGIAEEWTCDNYSTFEWMQKTIKPNHLQMGGQAGIIANTLAALGIQNVYVHTASQPKEQADLFFKLDNLLEVDEEGIIRPASAIVRSNDIPLIHWIFEFDGGDYFYLQNKQYICPKSNRFIATYDPDNSVLKMHKPFLQLFNHNGYEFMLLSGFHNLTVAQNGQEHIQRAAEQIKKWKKDNPLGVIHLEIASTQDKEIRAAIIREIAPLADSLGLNDCEAFDILEIIDPESFVNFQQAKSSPFVLLQTLLKIKEATKTPRIQLHLHGLYMTLQNRDFPITPLKNKNGMMLAATIAATKAGTGKIDNPNSAMWAHGKSISTQGIKLLSTLAAQLHCPELAISGICNFKGFNFIAVPTILIEKPLTLVGMGDTISSISLLGAR